MSIVNFLPFLQRLISVQRKKSKLALVGLQVRVRRTRDPCCSISMPSTAPTPPGYTVSGQDISVMFVSGHQKELGSHSCEQVLGWSKVTQTILAVFNSTRQLTELTAQLEARLAQWAEEGWMGRGKPVQTTVRVSEEKFFPPAHQFGKMKQVKVMFSDELATTLRFYVRHKAGSEERSLKLLSLESLAERLENAEQVESLELPVCLTLSLQEEIESCWKKKYLRRATKQKKPKSFGETYSDIRHSWRSLNFR